MPSGAQAGNIDVLYVDDSLVFLNKPPGLLSVPGKGENKQDCLSTRVQQVYPDARVVHRLDMATSGVLLMARGLAMQRVLSRAFADRQVHKRYKAIVHGTLLPPASGWGLIDLQIAVDWPRRPLRVIDTAHGKPSTTRWRVLDHFKNLTGPTTGVELEPLTGRSHQLRVHLQAIGHAIVGDALYPQISSPSAASSHRLLLHACELALVHPVHGHEVVVRCDADF
jgi:tRNA pseudouridine32 synthase/23S rRNA pseudouridine746 synthase